jgi:hypothetical protein
VIEMTAAIATAIENVTDTEIEDDQGLRTIEVIGVEMET